MSGGFSSGNNNSQTYQTSNSNSESGPPTPIAWELNQLGGNLFGYYQKNPNAPAYYPNSTVAPFSAQSQQAIDALFNRGANGSPLQTVGNTAALDTLGGKYLDLSNNPYLQGAIAYSQQPVIDAFNKQILPGITSTFAGAGRTPEADNLGGNAVATATDALTRNLAGAATTAGANAYNTERGNQMNVLGMVPALAGQDFANLNAMLTAGGALDQKAQQNIDADRARYDYNQTAQPNYYAQIAQLLQSIYPGATTTGSSNAFGSSTQASTGFGGKADLFSDRRLKTDIRPVGRLHDGQTVYSYRFRGSPRTELGLIAQEVEKRRPDAVRRHPNGFKMVDYRKATERRHGLL
jgi:hypothetical protein